MCHYCYHTFSVLRWLRHFSSLSLSGYFHPVSMPLLVLTLRSEAKSRPSGPPSGSLLLILRFPLSQRGLLPPSCVMGKLTLTSYAVSFLWPPPAILPCYGWFYRPVLSPFRLAPHCPAQAFLFLFFSFYWSIVHLQCSVSFCCTAEWFSYTYRHILFHILFHYGLS